MHPRVSQNPRRGFGPLGPVCCLTLLVAVRAGLPHRFLGFEELQSALGFAKPFRVTHPHTALVPTLAAERQHRSFRRDRNWPQPKTERPLGES